VFQVGNSDNPDNSNWEMNADGTGKLFVAPGLGGFPLYNALGGRPSALKYAAVGGRWFLKVEESNEDLWIHNSDGTDHTFKGRELFAYGYIDDVWQRIQVTDMASQGYRDTFEHPDDGVWSNDGADTFISMKPSRYRVEIDGMGRVFYREVMCKHIVRLNISGQELETLAAAGLEPLITSADPEFLEIMTQPAEQLTSWTFDNHHWNPTGTKLLYVEDLGSGPGVYVRDLVADTDQLIWQIPGQFVHSRWSPAGDKIVLNSLNAIWTVNPDGSGLLKVLSSKTESYYYPFFSPDGKWLVYRGSVSTNKGTSSWIARVPAAGGSPVNLTSDMNKLDQKYPEGWFAQ
jgi:hypothetical protein